MSWKGFVKAATRLPQQVARRTGHATETADPEYDQISAKFKHVEEHAKRLSNDATKFKDSLSAMLAHQQRFSETLAEVYRPVTAWPPASQSASSSSLGGLDAVDAAAPGLGERSGLGEKAAFGAKSGSAEFSDFKGLGLGSKQGSVEGAEFMGLSSKYDDESQHRASRAKVESFAHAMHEARIQLLPELEIIERQVVAPIKDWLVLIGNVHRLMDKRARKLVDYDRHAESVKKLQARTDRNLTDEKKLGSLEANLNESTRDFTSLNLTLKQQVPTFTSLAVAFINPCFATLYLCELRIFDVLHRCFGQYAAETGFNLSVPATAEFDAKHDEMMGMLESLSLAKRTYRKDSSANMGELGEDETPLEASPKLGRPAGVPNHAPSSSHAAPVGASAAPRPPFRPNEDEVLPAYDGHAHEAPTRIDGKAAYMPSAADASSVAAVGGGSSSAAPFAGVTTPNPPPRDAPSASPSYAVALYDFESAEAGDLSFKRDDKIEILERTEDVNDWWQGRIGARTGQFPANYVAHI
ncbi:hypothetical protein HDU87_004764 [Geranomyces variabilis]|uniref:BAR-domain-containing protein n=1 Tax=Geranomyces variabilis TaxID=109894 RepID=A0AAD5XPL5_9FUNG|nr:hypothetical protein HDU87_004764 [Geranomyces variabilis]